MEERAVRRGTRRGGLKPDAQATDNPLTLVKRLLRSNKGVAIGDCHGEMAITEFLAAHMKDFKEAGVTTFFIEMIPSRHRAAVKHFNKTGEVDKEFPVEPYLNEPVYSRWEMACVDYALNQWNGNRPGMKEQYLKVLHAAHEAGIEVVGIDGHEGAGQQRLEMSNPHWAAVIQQRVDGMRPEEKYLAFGGHYHFEQSHPTESGVAPVNQRLVPPIPSVGMDSTRHRKPHVLRNPLPQGAEWVALLPESPNQPGDDVYMRGHRPYAALASQKVRG